MSSVYQDLGETYTIKVGSTILFESVIDDPETGQVMDITDTGVFATAKVLLYKPNGNYICAPIVAQYSDRPNSIVSWQAGTFDNTLSGNWKGVIQLFNNASQCVTQQFFNFNVERVK